ncbi:hypothetical protein PMAN_a1893 [Pseudoalteromonas marina]|uniref:glycosyltransferase family 4 protein n=1 Tax=Pseudoalteromonas marina TaxID=267375 RepID=UPI00026CEA27|nr:glycosyltransferase family 4 protein [Pseudoalteromonas marina]KAF7780797.1 hypothetical protein PMAN_a1893 [Pseudoalteromonas marina]
MSDLLTKMKNNKFTVSCMGSRERYSLPLALNVAGKLNYLYTDIYMPYWATKATPMFNGSPAIKALLCRNHKDLPWSKVRQQFILGLDFRAKTRKAKTLAEKQQLLIYYGGKYAKTVGSQIKHGENLIAFTGGALESMRASKDTGGTVILDQVDPGLAEWELIQEETAKYSDWGANSSSGHWNKGFQERVKSELEIADEIIVNSEYSKKSIEYWGVDKKITVLPIASSISRQQRININTDRPLRLLCLGNVSIRKGVHYAVAAVDRLVKQGFKVELVLAGELLVEKSKLQEFSGHKYIGTVASNDIPTLIDSVDVLLFPTLSDGFGMVQVEAISRGTPVISSAACAQIIENNKSGFVIQKMSVDAIEECIEKYCNDRELLSHHSKEAYLRSEIYTQQQYNQIIRSKFST